MGNTVTMIAYRTARLLGGGLGGLEWARAVQWPVETIILTGHRIAHPLGGGLGGLERYRSPA
jgi:hypothetical protein